MAERRQDLFTLFRNTASLARPAAYSFVGGRLSAAVGGGAAWQDVEVAVSLLYQLGEGAPEGDTKPGTGVLAQLAAGIMATEVRAGWRVGWAVCCLSLQRSGCFKCGCRFIGGLVALQTLAFQAHAPRPCHAPRPWQVPAAKHRLVALALLETYVRYSRVAAAGGNNALPAVVARFLDSRGMGHPCEAVAKRAAYLFCRLAKQLRSNLRPLVPDILQVRLQHLLCVACGG